MNATVASLLAVAVIAAACSSGEPAEPAEAPRDPEPVDAPPSRAEDPAPEGARRASPELEAQVLGAVFGDTYGRDFRSQRLFELPAPFWRRSRLFLVVNYTWPHCPGAKVALLDDGGVVVLSGLADGLADREAPEGFNRVARAEGRAIAPDEAGAYLRFFLGCYIGTYEPQRLRATEAAAVAPAGEGGADDEVPVTADGERYLLRAFYRDHRPEPASIPIAVAARAATGEVDLLPVGR